MSALAGIAPRDGAAAPSPALDGFTVVRSDTALAFLVAPAVPAALAALVVSVGALSSGIGAAFIGFWLSFLALAFGGYLPALVLGVPAYLLMRRRTRVVPLGVATLVGGIVAALPWTALAIVEREEVFLLFAAVIFALGCIGGITFSFVRDGLLWRDVETGGEP